MQELDCTTGEGNVSVFPSGLRVVKHITYITGGTLRKA